MQTEAARLAIEGGAPAKRRPTPWVVPGAYALDAREEAAVIGVVRSGRLFRYYGLGDHESQVAAFERAFEAAVGVPHALGVNSGTSALLAALAAAGVGPGDEVVVPAYTWVATAMAVALLGGTPVVAEIDRSLTLDPRSVADHLTPRTKAVVPVHMRGCPSDMQPIIDLCRPRGVAVVEDVAQADGGSYRGRRLGAWGDAGCFSLQYNKMITAGEGGVVTTSSRRIYERATIFHDAAGTGGRAGFTEPAFIGYNFRMSELVGAVALAQLGKLDGLVARTRRAAAAIRSGIADLPVEPRSLPDPQGDLGICVVFFVPDAARRDEVCRALNAENVTCGGLWTPGSDDAHIYTGWTALLERRSHFGTWAPAGAETLRADACPRSLDWLHRSVCVEVHPAFDDADIQGTVEGIRRVVGALL